MKCCAYGPKCLMYITSFSLLLMSEPNKLKFLSLASFYRIVYYNTSLSGPFREHKLKGKAQYNWHLNRVACFFKKVNNVFNLKSSWSELVSTRRSTVPSPPLQLVFPGLFISNKEKDVFWGRIFTHVRHSHERAVSNLDRSMNISLWV